MENTENTTEKKQIQIRTYSNKELCVLYRAQRKTLKRWLAPYEKEIGRRIWNIYTPKQVEIIFEKLGLPRKNQTVIPFATEKNNSNEENSAKEIIEADENVAQYVDAAWNFARAILWKEGMADAYNNMETYYANKKDNKSARENAKLALQVATSIDYTQVVADAYNAIGNTFSNEGGNLDSALYYYDLALGNADKGCHKGCGKYIEGKVDAYNNIAGIHKENSKKERKKNRDKALENYYHALELAKDISYQEGIIIAEKGIAELAEPPAKMPPMLKGK